VSVTFGNKCNHRWFVNYGLYVDDNKLYNLCELTLPSYISEAHSEGRKKAGLSPSTALVGRPSNTQRNEVVFVIRALAAYYRAAVAAELEEDEEDAKTQSDKRVMVALRVLQDLEKMAKATLGGYKRSYDENKRIMAGVASLPRIPSLAEQDRLKAQKGVYTGRSHDVSMPEHRSLLNTSQCGFPGGIVSIIIDFLDESRDSNLRNIVAVTLGEQEVLTYLINFARIGTKLLESKIGKLFHNDIKFIKDRIEPVLAEVKLRCACGNTCIV
jgi:hypothetical protein